MVDSPESFREFVRNSRFDYNSLKPWEVETIKPYLDINELDTWRYAKLVKKCQVCGGDLDSESPEACPDLLRNG